MTEDNILEPYITKEAFRIEVTDGVDNAVGCNLYVFDLHYLQEYSVAQPTEVSFFANVIRENTAFGYFSF